MDHYATYQITLLGQPNIRRNESAVNINRKKCRAILYYLATIDYPVSRDKLQMMFWPDADAVSAKHNLNVNLYEIKKQAPGLIENADHGNGVQLAPSVSVDVRFFNSLLEADHASLPQLQQAIDLWQGDFLDGFTLADSPDFDNWRATEAVYYSSKYTDALIRAADLYAAAGDTIPAISFIQKALNSDPLKEDLYRKLMTLQSKNGDYLQVQHTYNRLKKVLREEINIEPMSETAALYASIMRNSTKGSTGQIAAPLHIVQRHRQKKGLMPFIGRGAELKAATEILHTESYAVLLVEGPPGVGKTRFFQECVNSWPGIGLYSTVVDGDESICFEPFVLAIKSVISAEEWVDQYSNFKRQINFIWWRNLRWLLPEIDPFDTSPIAEPPSKLSIMDSIKCFLGILSREEDVLVAIDDIHKCSKDTVKLLSHIINDSAQGHLRFLITLSSVKYNVDLNMFLQEQNYVGNLKRIRLGRLDYSCVAQFANLISINDLSVRRWLEEKSSGNAYIMTAYIKYALEYIGLAADKKDAISFLLQGDFVPQGVRSYILNCLAELMPSTCRLLYVAAVCGMQFHFEAVSKVANLQTDDALDALQQAMNYSLVRSTADGCYCFDHAAIRDALLDDITPAFRKETLRKISLVLQEPSISDGLYSRH